MIGILVEYDILLHISFPLCNMVQQLSTLRIIDIVSNISFAYNSKTKAARVTSLGHNK